MIASISGTVQSKGLDWLLVATSSGVGYKVSTTHAVVADYSINAPVSLLTYLVVREDQMSLYGFLTEAELNFFTQLIGVSGVGPRSALGVLNAGKVEELRSAIAGGEVAIFTTISGIGKKTAERIIVELKGKLDFNDTKFAGDARDLLTALTSLGYNAYEVKQILSDIPKDLSDTEDRIKYALKLLGK